MTTKARRKTPMRQGRPRQKTRAQNEAVPSEQTEQPVKQEIAAQVSVLKIPGAIAVGRLADLLGKSPVEVIKQMMRNGVMASINQVVDYETAASVARDFGFKPQVLTEHAEVRQAVSAEMSKLVEGEDDPSKLQSRSPVVTVLGHVDHGKTTLLDAIRKTNVAASEAGGITQHIGAYKVNYNGKDITFIDTPGHEAFTAMRARGSKVTDIAVLVVAADDGIMPQTLEAIDHAKAAGVPIVVAINKVDKPEADVERVKRELSDQGLVVEEWGGDIIAVPVSAKKGTGIDDLLENILILSEVSELKANPDRPAVGAVVEARLDKGKGPVATVLVQKGTLSIGDYVVVGDARGKVKAMHNDLGQRVKKAGPSTPVEVVGLHTVPAAGDTLIAVPDEKTAREVVEGRLRFKELERGSGTAPTLEEVYSKIEAGEVKELCLVIKTDVQGSVDAVRSSLEKLSVEKAKVKIIRVANGSVTESDVLLAMASKAIILGFNTRVEPGAVRLAEQEGVELRHYEIIYKLIEDVEKALTGLLEPEKRVVVEGHAEVRAVFSVGKRPKIAGLYVTDGKISRNTSVRVLRAGKSIAEGKVSSLKRFKDDVREVAAGYECGLGVENFTDFKEGDTIEAFSIK